MKIAPPPPIFHATAAKPPGASMIRFDDEPDAPDQPDVPSRWDPT